MEAVTAKEWSRHKDAGNNGPNERWPTEPRLPHVPISDRDRSLAVTALSLAVATNTENLTKVSFSNGARAPAIVSSYFSLRPLDLNIGSSVPT